MLLSFVIPCYRSEKTITAVCEELISVLNQKPEYSYEIITVNDCSPDNVIDVLEKLANENKNIKVIDLAKNVGKHSALMAGFRYSNGDYVVCLDDDGQCPVDKLWDLIEPLSGKYDVSMAQYGRKEQSGFKNFGSFMNAWMMTTMLGKSKDFQFANFAAMKKFVVKEIVRYDNPYSYVNGLILRTTKRLVNVPMKERARTEGTSGYTFWKSLQLWINGYTAFSVVPLRLATLLGGVSTALGLLLGIIAIVFKLLTPEITIGLVCVVAILLFLSGCTLLCMGLLGEYVGRIYMCINKAPQYVIRNLVNVESKEED